MKGGPLLSNDYVDYLDENYVDYLDKGSSVRH